AQTQKTDIKAIRSLAIEDARITPVEAGSKVSIDVKIVSDQINLVLDSHGQPVTGTDSITEFSDLWTFERVFGLQVNQADQWLLASACSA
ncbi:MAG: TIM44-like domain-containing protein, partial [Acetobacter sp.]|nr:TIM44-like domain-containing protein [Acetobacter sp.]